ncbi:hypothetical protein FHS32_006813, partial [Streptomyces albaduncus]|nr:hypothetical protein [Streptomyces albaduncus]
GHIVVSVARVAEHGDADVADGLPAGDVAVALATATPYRPGSRSGPCSASWAPRPDR